MKGFLILLTIPIMISACARSQYGTVPHEFGASYGDVLSALNINKTCNCVLYKNGQTNRVGDVTGNYIDLYNDQANLKTRLIFVDQKYVAQYMNYDTNKNAGYTWDAIENALTSKYGKPISVTDGISDRFSGEKATRLVILHIDESKFGNQNVLTSLDAYEDQAKQFVSD